MWLGGASGGDWLTWLFYTAPRLFVALHDHSVLAALTDASLDEVFDGERVMASHSWKASVCKSVTLDVRLISSLTQTRSPV